MLTQIITPYPTLTNKIKEHCHNFYNFIKTNKDNDIQKGEIHIRKNRLYQHEGVNTTKPQFSK